jgi:cell division control protein 6
MSLFDDNSAPDVFDDRDVLLDEHVPDDLVDRDDQINDYLTALTPVYDGHSPDHVFLFGPNGSGKTAATRFMLRELETSAEIDTDLSTVWLRCNSVGTDYMLAIKVANKILPPEKQLNRGYSEDRVYAELFDALDEIGGTIILVLDEIDRIEDLDTFMYEVTRARSAGGRLDEAKVGVIGISKTDEFYDSFSSDVKSTLNDKTIRFPPYEANELREILEVRVENAFKSDAVGDGVAPLCAAHATKYSGDARLALDLLREAGDLAKSTDDEIVDECHVEQALDDVLEDRVAEKMKNLNYQGKLVVYALCVLAAKGNDEPRTKEVFECYRELATRSGESPVVNVQVTDYLNTFADKGLTEKTENTGDGGRYNLHRLNYEIGEVLSALEPDIVSHSWVVEDSVAGLIEASKGVSA